MVSDFLPRHGAGRIASYPTQDPLFGVPGEGDEGGRQDVTLDYEVPEDAWTPQLVSVPTGWRAEDWAERPIRFIDGKDVGETVTCVYAAGGYPIPVRLDQIGATVVTIEHGVFRRRIEMVEQVVAMTVDPFPWDEVESFASALQANNLRLLLAPKPDGQLSFDFETMRNAAQNRCLTEMGRLEEAALASDPLTPTIVDGRLEPRQGGLDQDNSPIVGVIKTHRDIRLHADGMRVFYNLKPGERTPLFAYRQEKLPVVSWYLRLAGTPREMPNWGIIRVEVPLRWFERRSREESMDYVTQLCRMLLVYRCRERSYGRAPVSLHPIVRAEELLGALFVPPGMLKQHFYRLTGL